MVRYNNNLGVEPIGERVLGEIENAYPARIIILGITCAKAHKCHCCIQGAMTFQTGIVFPFTHPV